MAFIPQVGNRPASKPNLSGWDYAGMVGIPAVIGATKGAIVGFVAGGPGGAGIGAAYGATSGAAKGLGAALEEGTGLKVAQPIASTADLSVAAARQKTSQEEESKQETNMITSGLNLNSMNVRDTRAARSNLQAPGMSELATPFASF
tara:strand:- start:6903 stop:7343 length:441 start_codon:yes stop_codon:yes gene_type:complete